MASSELHPGDLAARLGDWNDNGGRLYDALAGRLEAVIRSGVVPPGVRLPAERRLAEQLHVSRGTVVAAYERLREHGIVATRHGSGTVVLPGGSPVSGAREAHLASSLPHESVLSGILSLDDDAIDLRGAYWIGGANLPEPMVHAAYHDLQAYGADHGYHPLGLPPLREAIALHLTSGGLETTPEQILVTTGAQQGITLLVGLHVSPGETVVMEDPTYTGAIEASIAAQARIATVPVGPSGPDLPSLSEAVRRHAPRLIYLVPSVHNPTGTVMPGLARRRVAEQAADWDAIVVDDRTVAETQFDGLVPPPLASYADGPACNRIVTVGSLSKVLWGGLRVGWVRAAEPMIARLGRLKSIHDLGSPIPSQLLAVRLMAQADVFADQRRAALHRRMTVITERLAAVLPQWRWATPSGGYCLWVDIGQGDAAEFCHVAARHGLGLIPGSSSSPTAGHRRMLRLPYGQPEAVLVDAADRLAAAWDDYRTVLGAGQSRNVSVVV